MSSGAFLRSLLRTLWIYCRIALNRRYSLLNWVVILDIRLHWVIKPLKILLECVYPVFVQVSLRVLEYYWLYNNLFVKWFFSFPKQFLYWSYNDPVIQILLFCIIPHNLEFIELGLAKSGFKDRHKEGVLILTGAVHPGESWRLTHESHASSPD